MRKLALLLDKFQKTTFEKTAKNSFRKKFTLITPFDWSYIVVTCAMWKIVLWQHNKDN